jgi:hypothetical protein
MRSPPFNSAAALSSPRVQLKKTSNVSSLSASLSSTKLTFKIVPVRASDDATGLAQFIDGASWRREPFFAWPRAHQMSDPVRSLE